jgi:hypothetical protein
MEVHVRTRFRFAHFYRVSHGDSGFKPVPISELEDDAVVEEVVSKALLDRFNDPYRRMKPPHTADLIDEHGALVFRLRVTNPTSVRRDP